MTENEILKQQVEALEKLLQLKSAIIEELEAKINKLELQQAQQQLQSYPGFMTPYISPPMGPCINGQQCVYPSMWHGTIPPACSRCGKSQGLPSWTLSGQAMGSVASDKLVVDDPSLGQLLDIDDGTGYTKR